MNFLMKTYINSSDGDRVDTTFPDPPSPFNEWIAQNACVISIIILAIMVISAIVIFAVHSNKKRNQNRNQNINLRPTSNQNVNQTPPVTEHIVVHHHTHTHNHTAPPQTDCTRCGAKMKTQNGKTSCEYC